MSVHCHGHRATVLASRAGCPKLLSDLRVFQNIQHWLLTGSDLKLP